MDGKAASPPALSLLGVAKRERAVSEKGSGGKVERSGGTDVGGGGGGGGEETSPGNGLRRRERDGRERERHFYSQVLFV